MAIGKFGNDKYGSIHLVKIPPPIVQEFLVKMYKYSQIYTLEISILSRTFDS